MTLKRHSLAATPVPVKVNAVEELMPAVRELSESDLQELRHQIDVMLCLDLGSLNLGEELGLQFRQAKALQHTIAQDKHTPANQQAQLLNSVRSQLTEIIKQQEAVWSMERLKKYEVAFVKVAGMMTEEQRAIFFDLYGQYLKDPTAAGGPAPDA